MPSVKEIKVEKDYIIYNDKKIEYYFNRKPIKNIHIKVNLNSKIIVSVPKRIGIAEIRKIVTNKMEWINKAQSRVEKSTNKRDSLDFEDGDLVYILGNKFYLRIIEDKENYIQLQNECLEMHVENRYLKDKEYMEKTYNEWLKEMLEEELNKAIYKYYEVLKEEGIPDPVVEIRKMKSRWGTCLCNKDKIVFNLLLIKTPIECIEYVVLHEFSHFKHPNHSKDFYNFIERYMPDWKLRRKILKEEYSGIE